MCKASCKDFFLTFIAGAQRRERSVLSGLKALEGCLGMRVGEHHFRRLEIISV